MNATAIYLQKRKKVIVPAPAPRHETDSKQLAATIAKNFEAYGYTLSEALAARLCALTRGQLSEFYDRVLPVLSEMRGARRKHRPMYPNFPKQVMEMSEVALYWNAIIHYWTNSLPDFPEEKRLPLYENHPLTAIDLGDETDFKSIFTQLLAAKSSISEYDKSICRWFLATYKHGVLPLVPAVIGMKEQAALTAGELLQFAPDADLAPFAKTATDVLRIAVGLCGGDVSLAESTKFTNKLRRPVRRALLSVLENVPNRDEEMARYHGQWKRLGERLHPGEFKGRFPKTLASFKKVRNDDEPIPTFNSQVEAKIKRKNFEVIKLLAQRPGDFARRLDKVMRTFPRFQQTIAEEFLKVAGAVATPVLLQVMHHFSSRSTKQSLRTVFPKGSTAKMQVLENTPEPLSAEICATVSNGISKTLVARFRDLPSLGKVYVDPKLASYPVPFAQRSASKVLKTLARGSRIDLKVENTVRFFVWWKNGEDRTDIDLSAAILNEDWSLNTILAYYNLKDFGGHHSGDIVDAPKGASEFIDIDLHAVDARGGRYIAMVVSSFTQQPFKNLPECFAGWMSRLQPNSGEIFEPKTVCNKVDLAGDTTNSVPLLIDVVEKKVIWCDVALRGHPNFANNVASNQKGLSIICRALAELNKPTLATLFNLHAEARGIRVDSPEDADIVFAEHKGVTPVDIDKIVAEYL